MGSAAGALSSVNAARFVAEMFREAEGLEPEDTDHMVDLLRRDINRIDRNRYASPLMFSTPAAISTTIAGRSSIATHINEVIAAGHPLTLSLHSLATKVLFEKCGRGKTPRAVGVEYLVGEGLYSADGRYNASQTGEVKTVRARKEVIVAGGAFNTPQILKLSGIGPRKELESLGIPVLVDLPAVVRPVLSVLLCIYSYADASQGNFMQDNYEISTHINATAPWLEETSFPCNAEFDETDACFVQWQANRTGPYAQRGGTFTMTWRSSVSWDNDADLLFLSSAGFGGTSGFYPEYSRRNVRPTQWNTPVVKMQTGNPSGTVTLRSRDPRQAPEINFNYFAQQGEEDLQALSDGIDLMLRTYDAVGIPYTVLSPDPSVDRKQGIMDRAYSHHATSSCRMGPRGHRDYCVDSEFRVNGVDGLRVVDASVLPRVPGGMPNGPTFTISRKALEAILKGK